MLVFIDFPEVFIQITTFKTIVQRNYFLLSFYSLALAEGYLCNSTHTLLTTDTKVFL